LARVEHAPSPDRGSLAGTLARRRAAGRLPLGERLVAQRPVRRSGPPDVVELVVDRVLGAALDDSLLVGGMAPGLLATDEARPHVDALRPEPKRAGEARSIADPARGEH